MRVDPSDAPNTITDADHTGQILSAWIAKEDLRVARSKSKSRHWFRRSVADGVEVWSGLAILAGRGPIGMVNDLFGKPT